MVAAAAFILAYVTIFGFDTWKNTPGIYDKTFGFVIFAAVLNSYFGTSRGSWRYVSIPDFLNIIKSSTAAVVLYTTAAFILSRGENVPRSVPIITLLYLVTGLSASRLAYRLFHEYRAKLSSRNDLTRAITTRNVLLLGVTDVAESFIRSTRRDSHSAFRVVGIVDDARKNHGRLIQGIRVLGPLYDVKAIVASFANGKTPPVELVVAEINPNRKRLGQIVELATTANLKVLRIPNFSETSVVTADFRIEPRAIELSELLGRDEVFGTDTERVTNMIADKVVVVTGAGGSIGSELCRQIAAAGPRELVLIDNSEYQLYTLDMELKDRYKSLTSHACIADVRDSNRILEVFEKYRPSVVFHAAALKHVPLVESNPLEGIKTNFLGTRNVANAAISVGASSFVMISTDKAVNPANVMGATKRAAEAYCQALDLASAVTRFKTVRFGNVLGSNGSVVPRFQEQIANHGPVTVTHPHIVRYFMTIPEAVRLVLHAAGRASELVDDRGKIMVLDMGEPVKIVDLAERLIQLAGYRPHEDIKIVFTGLRPGEKLFEELFDPSEVVGEKSGQGYAIASPRIVDRSLIETCVSDLEAAIDEKDADAAVAILKTLVPEFVRAGAESAAAE